MLWLAVCCGVCVAMIVMFWYAEFAEIRADRGSIQAAMVAHIDTIQARTAEMSRALEISADQADELAAALRRLDLAPDDVVVTADPYIAHVATQQAAKVSESFEQTNRKVQPF